MNEDYLELNIQFLAEDIINIISAEELTLIESVMPDLIVAIMQSSDQIED